MSHLFIRVAVMPGIGKRQAYEEILTLAKQTGANIVFDWNGVLKVCDPYTGTIGDVDAIEDTRLVTKLEAA